MSRLDSFIKPVHVRGSRAPARDSVDLFAHCDDFLTYGTSARLTNYNAASIGRLPGTHHMFIATFTTPFTGRQKPCHRRKSPESAARALAVSIWPGRPYCEAPSSTYWPPAAADHKPDHGGAVRTPRATASIRLSFAAKALTRASNASIAGSWNPRHGFHAGTSGRTMRTSRPRGSRSNSSIVPPCPKTTERAIARPRPIPRLSTSLAAFDR